MTVSLAALALLAAASPGEVVLVGRAVRSLQQAVAERCGGAAQVASAARQAASASLSLAQGFSQQAAPLAQTSATSGQINDLSKKNSDSARSAAEVVTSTQTKFQQANPALGEAVRILGEIEAQSDRSSRILPTIDEIAFQTNLHALNPAVEAARAGRAARVSQWWPAGSATWPRAAPRRPGMRRRGSGNRFRVRARARCASTRWQNSYGPPPRRPPVRALRPETGTRRRWNRREASTRLAGRPRRGRRSPS